MAASPNEAAASSSQPAMSPSSNVKDPFSLIATYNAHNAGNPDDLAKRGFEGPEKRLEVITRVSPDRPKGLRLAPKETWAEVVGILNARIESTVSNDELDSYVLTESSLFVYPNRVLLITCGTTILLNALPKVLEVVKEYGCEVEWSSFMRKNFSYPWEQVGPHATMQTEYTILKQFFPSGRPFIFGPIDSDHYFFFVYDDIHRPCIQADNQLSLTMYGLDPEFTKNFFSTEQTSDNAKTSVIRKASGLDRLFDHCTVQDLQFEPCGYSVNAIEEDGTYWTSHITPEDHCSFASFETNAALESVGEVLEKTLDVYKPERFSMVLLADPDTKLGPKVANYQSIGDDCLKHYGLKNRSVNEWGPGHFVVKASFVRTTL